MLEVVPGLLLGSMGDALAVISNVPSVAKQHTVTHILTIANTPLDWSDYYQLESSVNNSESKFQTDGEGKCDAVGGDSVRSGTCDPVTEEELTGGHGRFRTKFVCVADMPESNLLHHFEDCCQFMKEGVLRGTVLVHCVHGISRSVTVVLAYQMWSERRSFQVLFDLLKDRKPEIRPNPGFIEQLKLWGAMKCRIDINNKQYKADRLKIAAREMKDVGYIGNLDMSPDPSAGSIDSVAYYCCKKCRRLLFTDHSVLPHEVGKGQSAFKWHKRSNPGSADLKHSTDTQPQDTMCADHEATPTASQDLFQAEHANNESLSLNTEDSSLLSTAHSEVTPQGLAAIRAQVAAMVSLNKPSSVGCSSYFVEPIEWMESTLLGQVEGKILCCKCSARLGSFNWSGDQCSCGQWITPSIQIHRSKVDETRTLTRRKAAAIKD